MDAKCLFWATPLNNSGISEYESRTPYLIFAAINEAGNVVYGAENIVDVPTNKILDEILPGSITDRLFSLTDYQLESNLTRSSKTVLNGIYNEILICEVPDYSVLKPKQ